MRDSRGEVQDLTQLPEQPPDSSADAPGLADEERRLEHRALELAIRAEFEDRTWEAFWQTTIQRRRAADVADELGMSTAAVYQAKSRVMRRMGIGDAHFSALLRFNFSGFHWMRFTRCSGWLGC